MLRGCGPEDYHFHLTEVSILSGMHLYLHWLPLVKLATSHQVSLFATPSTHSSGNWHHLGSIPCVHWEHSYLMWMMWLVTIGWDWVFSVAMLAAEVGVAVVPWYGHHAKHIPTSWKDSALPLHCFFGGSGDCHTFCFSESAREVVILSEGVAVSSNMAMHGLVPSISTDEDLFDSCISLQMNPWPLAW